MSHVERAAAMIACCALLASQAVADEGTPGAGPEHGKLATSDATPVAPGAVELEVGYLHSSLLERAEAGAWATHHGLAASATYGFAEDLDLRLAAGLAHATASPRPAHGGDLGLEDLAAGLRWRVLADAAHALDVALLATAIAPIGGHASDSHPAFSQEHWSGGGALVATKDWGSITTNAELGVDAPFAGDAGGRRLDGFANAGGGVQLSPWLQPELELHYRASLGSALAHAVAVTCGAIVPLPGEVRLSLGVTTDVWSSAGGRPIEAIAALKVPLRR